MIILTRISGERIALNPDLIHRVESRPHTVVQLVDGAEFPVRQTLDEVARLMLEYRVAVVSGRPPAQLPLRLVD